MENRWAGSLALALVTVILAAMIAAPVLYPTSPSAAAPSLGFCEERPRPVMLPMLLVGRERQGIQVPPAREQPEPTATPYAPESNPSAAGCTVRQVFDESADGTPEWAHTVAYGVVGEPIQGEWDYDADGTADLHVEWHYEADLLLSKAGYRADGARVFTTTFTYDERLLRYIREDSSTPMQIDYYYDTLDRLIRELTRFGSNGDDAQTVSYQYFKAKLVARETIDFENDGISDLTIWRHYADDRLIREDWDEFSDGSMDGFRRLTYNVQGDLTRREALSALCIPVGEWTEYAYDIDHRLVSSRDYSGGKLHATQDWTYDHQGRLISYKRWAADGGNSVASYIYSCLE